MYHFIHFLLRSLREAVNEQYCLALTTSHFVQLKSGALIHFPPATASEYIYTSHKENKHRKVGIVLNHALQQPLWGSFPKTNHKIRRYKHSSGLVFPVSIVPLANHFY